MVRGKTFAEREDARTKLRAQRRIGFFHKQMAKAQTPRQELAIATDMAKAIGDELDDNGRRNLAIAIVQAAEERNPHRDSE